MMAKWNWGGERVEDGRTPDGSSSHPSGHAGCAVDGASRVDPLRGAVTGAAGIRLNDIFPTSICFTQGGKTVLKITCDGELIIPDVATPTEAAEALLGEWKRVFACDSRSKPVRAETVEQGSVHESDGGEANRPENPAYFWLGIQAEGRE